MSKLKWDATGERYYETGVDQGVLYPIDDQGEYSEGFAWNGLTTVNDSPEGAESNKQYADNIAYLNLISAEDEKGSIEAFTYPEAFAECDGSEEVATGVYISQQNRKTFGLCYRSKIGNDINSDLGYKLHIIYNAKASPSEKSYTTINDSPEAINFSWDFETLPVPFPGHKPTAKITIDSTRCDANDLAALEDILYGTDPEGGSTGTTARLPLPEELCRILHIPTSGNG